MSDQVTKEDIAELLREIRKDPLGLSQEELQTLREIIKDRQAMSRAWNWLLWGLGSLSTVIVAYGVITGSIIDWIKDHIK